MSSSGSTNEKPPSSATSKSEIKQPDNETRGQAYVRTILSRWAAFTAGLTTIAVAAKILTLAHGDVTTISSIVKAVSLSDMLLPAVVTSLPIIATWAYLGTNGFVMEAVRERDTLAAPAIATGISAFAAFAFAPAAWFWTITFLLAVNIASSIGIRLFRHWRTSKLGIESHFMGGKHPRQNHLEIVVGLVFAVAFVAFLLTDRPWLPIERVQLTTTSQPLVGYVLSNDDDQTVFLDHNTRTARIIASSEIQSQTLCQVDTKDDRSVLFSLIWKSRSAYPPCV